MPQQPAIVITGASGFLGRRLVRDLRRSHHVVAIDRHPPGDTAIATDPCVTWHRIDLSDSDAVGQVFESLRRRGGAFTVIHLAGYYDFTGQEHPEYQRTNVDAMRLVLEHSRQLGVRRFVFASSIAACDFSGPGRPISEQTAPGGRHIYARTKRAGEEMLREHADEVPSCIVRFAALFSDWCEYPPLYFFLDTWLSNRWNARVLGGRGQAAIPYLHVRDATRFVRRVLDRSDELDRLEVLNASTEGSVSHAELFGRATEYFFGRRRRPVHLPRPLCGPGIRARDWVGRLLGSRPFERSWMTAYIDRRMDVDADRTYRRLGWRPRERLHVLNRIPFMIENAKTSPMEWYGRNLEALEHHELRPRFLVYRLVQKYESEIEREFARKLDARPDDEWGEEERGWMRRSAWRSLVQAIRTGEKSPFTLFCQELAERGRQRGVAADALVRDARALGEGCLEVLRRDAAAEELAAELRQSISVTVEFGVDRILEVYEDGAGLD